MDPLVSYYKEPKCSLCDSVRKARPFRDGYICEDCLRYVIAKE